MEPGGLSVLPLPAGEYTTNTKGKPMRTQIDPDRLYSSDDLAAIGIGYEAQRKANERGQLKPVRIGTGTFRGSDVLAFLGLTDTSAEVPATSTAPAVATLPAPSEATTRADKSFQKFLRSGGLFGIHIAGRQSASPVPTVTENRPMNAIEQFEQAVDDKMRATGWDRPRATAAVVRDDPDLHKRYVQAINHNRRTR